MVTKREPVTIMHVDAVRQLSVNAIKSVDCGELPSASDAMGSILSLNARSGQISGVIVDKALVLYGAGELGKLASRHLATVGVAVECVVDRNAHACKDDPDWVGYRVIAPEDVDPALKQRSILAVSIVTVPFASLQAALLSEGWQNCFPFYDVAECYTHIHPLKNGWYAHPLEQSDLEACQHILEGLADDRSRAHYLRFAAWRFCREEWDYKDAPVIAEDRYFIPEITSILRVDERVFDVGAHHGLYLLRLLKTKGSLSFAWAVEPDPSNHETLKRLLSTLNDTIQQRIECHGCVIGSQSQNARFHAGLGYASQVAPTGQTLVDGRTIDSFGADPTVIKLHIEGGELDALEGARETIRRHRPIVMATIYHNQDGLTRTPLWLMRQLDGYNIFLRQHNWCGTGVVVYAIPELRRQ